jgi:glycyl-tRNA synthetase
MSLRPIVAPIKIGIYHLTNSEKFDPYINTISESLTNQSIVIRIDQTSGSIGRRYSRADELGLPFGITIDFQTFDDKTVTIRDRDSMTQIRVSMDILPSLLLDLVTERMEWSVAFKQFPQFVYNESEETADNSSNA